jgi:hypothetical protein
MGLPIPAAMTGRILLVPHRGRDGAAETAEARAFG